MPPSGPPRHLLARLEGLQRRVGRELSSHLPAELAGLRGSAGRTLGILPEAGARPSELAEGTAMTKQSMGERLREMERRGWISIETDPHDRRARIVRRTREGDRVRSLTERAIADLESEFAAQVGHRRYRTFLAVLAELGDSVEITPDV